MYSLSSRTKGSAEKGTEKLQKMKPKMMKPSDKMSTQTYKRCLVVSIDMSRLTIDVRWSSDASFGLAITEL